MSDSTCLRTWIFDRFLPQNLRARDSKTHNQYRFACNDFAEFLGREPVLSDLEDERYAAFVNYLLLNRRLAAITANERAGRIKTFWNWAARKRIVETFPTIQRVPVPEKFPRSWRREQLERLFESCRQETGTVGDIPAGLYWFTIHGFWWCTAERVTATLAMEVDHLDLDEGWASLPASIRKGKQKPAVYSLWPDLIAQLRRILPPFTKPRRKVFEWDRNICTFYNHYSRILLRAGLPDGRDCKPHRMRVSHATWTKVAGGDPTEHLGHSSDATTRKSYLDPTITRSRDDRQLFRPWKEDGDR